MKKLTRILLVVGTMMSAMIAWGWHWPQRNLTALLLANERVSYEMVAQSDDPLLQALYTRQIHAGSTIDMVRPLATPVWQESYGRFTVYGFDPQEYSWRTLITDGDRVVSANAGNCTWSWTFFDEVSPEVRSAIASVRTLRQALVRYPDRQSDFQRQIQEKLNQLAAVDASSAEPLASD